MKKALAIALIGASLLSGATAASAQDYRYRDRDRDGIPNQYDRYDNRGMRDRDRDGVPNRYDRYDNRGMRDRDRDGVPNRYDRYDNRRLQYWGGNYGYNGYRGHWRTGQRYSHYRDRGYYISDYRAYGLPAPRAGYRYYRDDNGDIVMAAIASGIIGLIIGGALDH
jgi:Ni/Co efflux regulator RcnB